MENQENNVNMEESREGYVPRPQWQVRMARVGLVLFLLFVIWQIVQIATGGLL